MSWYFLVLKRYAIFTGRARRKEYWFFILFFSIVYLFLSVIDILANTYSEKYGLTLFGSIYVLANWFPALAVTVRRLHDTNRSGWWVLPYIIYAPLYIIYTILSIIYNMKPIASFPIISILPIAYSIVLIVFAALPSDPGKNKYGPNPIEEEGGYLKGDIDSEQKV